MSFAEYIEHGWRLCAIPSGGKAPKTKDWNEPGPQAHIPPGYGAGLMHVESQTCAIDIDKLDTAAEWLAARRIQLSALLGAPETVRISSGRTGRAKLLYRLDRPLVSQKTAPFRALSAKSGKEETYTALDFRCATKGGLSLQDVLPPSIHPDTGRPYAWEYGDDLTGTWRNLPPLPDSLRTVWESLLTAKVDTGPAAPSGASFDEIRTIIAQQDPNAAYNEWLRVGMAIHHETGGSRDGLLLWNEWSARAAGPDKYKGLADLEPHWRSFSASAAGAVTLGSLRAEAVAGVGDFPVVLASTEAKRKFQRRSFDTFISGKPPEWIVEGVLPAATIGAVYGPSGSGKSFLVTDMAFHIAEGRPWRDLAVKKQRVVYLIAEGVAGGRLRLRTARDELGFDTAGFEVVEDTPNLLNKEDPPALARELRAPDEDGQAANIGLVIVDTLAQTTPGADENSGKDMSVALEHCKLIHQATGAMVLLVAHAGKDVDRGLRGWSGIRAALDVEIECSDTQPGTPGSLRVAKVTKMKDGEEGATFGFKLRGVGKSCVVEHTDEKPRARAQKYRAGSADDLIRQVYPTIAPIGHGGAVATTDLVNAVVDRMAPEMPDRRVERITKALNTFCARPDSGLQIRGGVVVSTEAATDFALRPVGGYSGIDGEQPAAQDHGDLMGVQ